MPRRPRPLPLHARPLARQSGLRHLPVAPPPQQTGLAERRPGISNSILPTAGSIMSVGDSFGIYPANDRRPGRGGDRRARGAAGFSDRRTHVARGAHRRRLAVAGAGHAVPAHFVSHRRRAQAKGEGAGRGAGPGRRRRDARRAGGAAEVSRHPAGPGSVHRGARSLAAARLFDLVVAQEQSRAASSLTVDAVRYQVEKRTRLGVASTFLGGPRRARRQDQGLCAEGAAFRAAGRSHQADHHDRPGHRPRAVPRLSCRSARRPKRTGPNWLYFGHQRSDYDFFYEDELQAMRSAGLLTRLTLAWSRDSKEKIYVQHRMRDDGRDLWAWLSRGRAHLCVRRCLAHGQGRRARARRHRRRTWQALSRKRRALCRRVEEERPLSSRCLLGDCSSVELNASLPKSQGPEWGRWRGCRCSSRSKASAPSSPAAARLRPGRRSCFRPRARGSMSSRRRRATSMLRTRRCDPPRGAIVLLPARLDSGRFCRRRCCHRRFRRRRRGRGFCRRRARRRRAGQCDRPAGVLRFRLRRHRQSFAAGHRHFDRWCCAGVRPGHPRQDRSADPERFCPLGRSRARLPAAGEALALPFRGRRRFWQKFTARAIAAPDRAPADADLDALLAPAAAAEAGSVILVGAGPGNPELLTLRAVRALQSADVILFDALVSPDVLDFARREAQENAGRQDRLRTVLQPGRHQRADGFARQSRAAAWCGSRAAIR